jgi:hypothetical protein
MAKIIKKITGLKPGQNYLFVLKAKNTELSAVDSAYESIRIQTPIDQSIPGSIEDSTFFIYGNYKSVMFSFEPTSDLDVREYEYELYADALGATLISTGKATSSVFTIDVPNNSGAATDSSTQSDVVYYGRIRAIDTSGNSGGWTPSSGLKQSSATELIDSQHVRSLTASKITAGTINAHEIILKQQGAQTTINAPANMAIIRSSNYNGSYNNNTSTWTDGTAGWVIGGDGHAEFSSASIRGTVKAGSIYINANNRWKTNTAGVEITAAEFRVGDANSFVYWDGNNTLSVKGSIQADSGTIAGWTIFENELQAGNFSGAVRLGGGVGPIPPGTYPGGSYTGELQIASPISPGVEANVSYNGYHTRWKVGTNNPSWNESYAMEATAAGMIYQYGSERFEFRIISGNPYIVIDGTQYQLTIGGGSPSDGGGDPGSGPAPAPAPSGGGGTTCTPGTVLNGSCCGLGPCFSYTTTYADCSTDTYCDGPNCEQCGIILV